MKPVHAANCVAPVQSLIPLESVVLTRRSVLTQRPASAQPVMPVFASEMADAFSPNEVTQPLRALSDGH
jgi:hypothetical protein